MNKSTYMTTISMAVILVTRQTL